MVSPNTLSPKLESSFILEILKQKVGYQLAENQYKTELTNDDKSVSLHKLEQGQKISAASENINASTCRQKCIQFKSVIYAFIFVAILLGVGIYLGVSMSKR